jgi:hypothetical protein
MPFHDYVTVPESSLPPDVPRPGPAQTRFVTVT